MRDSAHHNLWCTRKREPQAAKRFFAPFLRGEKNLSGPRRSQAVPSVGPKGLQQLGKTRKAFREEIYHTLKAGRVYLLNQGKKFAPVSR